MIGRYVISARNGPGEPWTRLAVNIALADAIAEYSSIVFPDDSAEQIAHVVERGDDHVGRSVRTGRQVRLRRDAS